MAGRITAAEMESRGRIIKLQSALTEAYCSVQDVSYEEVLLAMTEILHRIASNNWKVDFRQSEEV